MERCTLPTIPQCLAGEPGNATVVQKGRRSGRHARGSRKALPRRAAPQLRARPRHRLRRVRPLPGNGGRGGVLVQCWLRVTGEGTARCSGVRPQSVRAAVSGLVLLAGTGRAWVITVLLLSRLRLRLCGLHWEGPGALHPVHPRLQPGERPVRRSVPGVCWRRDLPAGPQQERPGSPGGGGTPAQAPADPASAAAGARGTQGTGRGSQGPPPSAGDRQGSTAPSCWPQLSACPISPRPGVGLHGGGPAGSPRGRGGKPADACRGRWRRPLCFPPPRVPSLRRALSPPLPPLG